LYIGRKTAGWLDTLKSFLMSVPSAIGEIGLDHAVEPRNDKDQEEIFVAQLHLARKLERPVTIHCRKAWGRLLEILRFDGGLRCGGIVHSYSGAPEMIRPLEELGLSISFSGAITRDENKRGRRAITFVMKERLLLETDSPDLTPVGATSPCNEPANLPLVLREAALLLGKPAGEVAEMTFKNAERLFTL
jgi:TatD DNase family protein